MISKIELAKPKTSLQPSLTSTGRVNHLMPRKLILIGPESTGKTTLSFYLAKLYNFDLICSKILKLGSSKLPWFTISYYENKKIKGEFVSFSIGVVLSISRDSNDREYDKE